MKMNKLYKRERRHEYNRSGKILGMVKLNTKYYLAWCEKINMHIHAYLNSHLGAQAYRL